MTFVSMWDEDELCELSRSEKKKKVGLKADRKVLQPPVCRKCGGGCVEVELDCKYLQCIECGFMRKANYFDNLRFRRKK